jgi:tetratricopeptide (TPR) repeat protein
MKKHIVLIVAMFFCVQLFAEELYFYSDFSEAKEVESTWKEVVPAITEFARKKGYDIVDAGKAPTEWEISSAIWKKKNQECAKKQKNQFDKMLSDSHISVIAGDENDDTDQEEIVIPEIHYPCASIYCSVNQDRDEFSIKVNWCFDKDTSELYDSDFVSWSATNDEDTREIVEKYAEAILDVPTRNKNNTPKKISPLDGVLINTSSVRMGTSFSVAACDDFSFVVRNENTVNRYNSSFEKTADLTRLFQQSDSKQLYVPYCPDGKHVILGKVNTGIVLSLSDENTISGKTTYHIPAGMYTNTGFTSDGQLILLQTKRDSFNNATMSVLYMEKDATTPHTIKIPGHFSGLVSGPEKSIYVLRDNVVCKYSADGKLEKAILTDKDITTSDGYRIAKVLPDSSFIIDQTVYRNGRLLHYASDGTLLAECALSDDMRVSVMEDYANGIYYLFNLTTGQLFRYVEDGAPIPPELTKIAQITQELEKSPADYEKKYLQLADCYYNLEGYTPASEWYAKYLETCPADNAAAAKKFNSDVILEKRSAKADAEEALSLFDEYGEETAKEKYQTAMKSLEHLKKQVPWDKDVQDMYRELKNTFAPDATDVAQKIPSVQIDEVDLTCLFPALLNVYATNPSGTMTIKNTSSNKIANIKVSAYLRKYMDFASTGTVVPELQPGESCSLNINTLLNKNALTVDENTVLQMQYTVTWQEDGAEYSTTFSRPVTMYKKSAMTWVDTAMLSCFILPNNETVSSFAFKVLGNSEQRIASKKFTQAMQIVNALGSIPLTYVSDPDTPISKVIDNDYAVDTVRFPDETLLIKGGDCDDMTVLLCSTLEAAGIHTALITIPGHIFAAFNAETKYNFLWNTLADGYKAIENDGQVWIPIEVTLMQDGFAASWKKASEEIADKQYEFIKVSDASCEYPPVPSNSAKQEVTFTSTKYKTLSTQSQQTVCTQVLIPTLQKQSTAKADSKSLNLMAQMYYNIGQNDNAIELLKLAIAKDKSYTPAVENIIALYDRTGDTINKSVYEKMLEQKSTTEITESKSSSGKERADSQAESEWKE